MNIFTDIHRELGELTFTRGRVWFLIGLLSGALLFVNWRWYYFSGGTSIVIFGIVAALILGSAVRWRMFIPLYRAWMLLALFLGWFVLRALLILVFFLLVTPLGFFLRITGKDLMGRRAQATYWHATERAEKKDRYLKKF